MAIAPIKAIVLAPAPKLARLTIQPRMIRPAPIADRRSRGLNFSQIAMDTPPLPVPAPDALTPGRP